MKTVINKFTTAAISLAALLITGSTWAVDAPTPTAVWEVGEFSNGEKNGCTLTMFNSTVDADGAAVIVNTENITNGKNINIKWAYSSEKTTATVIVKFDSLNLQSSSSQVLAMMGGRRDSSNGWGNYIGAALTANNSGNLVYVNKGEKAGTADSATTMPASSGIFAISYNQTSENVKTYYQSKAGEAATKILEKTTFKNRENNAYPELVNIGSRDDKSMCSTGMRVLGVAVFVGQELTADQIGAYVFPSDIPPPVPGIISINITNANTTDVNADIQTLASDDLIPAGGWINVGYPAVNSERKGSTSTVKYAKGTETGTVSGATFAWTSAGTGFQNMLSGIGSSITFMKDAYCRGSGASLEGSTFTLTGVPYKDYDVIVYISGKTENVNKSITVNGTAYYGGEVNDAHPYGTYVGDSTSWGSVNAPSTLVMGQNAIRITDQTDSTLVISTPNPFGGNWGVAAIQVIERFIEGPTKATATISANTTWGEGGSGIIWDDDFAPTASLPAELTFTGNYTVTLNEAPTCSKIILKGSGNATIDAGSYTCPAIDASGLTGTVTITTATKIDVSAGANDFIYNYTGSTEISPTLTYTGNFTKGGTGTMSLSHNVPSGKTLTVVGGTLKLDAGTKGISGTVNINADATFVNCGDSDRLNYDGSPTVNIYGKLNMQSLRWTVGASNVLNLYPGAEVIGAGDGNKAWDFIGNSSQNIIHFKKNGDVGGVITFNSTLRARSGNVTLEVEDGVAAEFGSSVQLHAVNAYVKTGAGTLKLLSGSSFTRDLTVNAGTLEVAGGTTTGTTTISAGATLKVSGACASNFTVNGALVFNGGSLTGTISGTPTSITVEGETPATGYLAGATFGLAENATLVLTGATDPLIPGTINSVGSGAKVKLPQGFAFGTIANVGEGVTAVTVVNAAGEPVTAAKVENGKLIVPKSEIVTEYDVEGTKDVAEDIAFGVGGSIVFKTDASTLNVTGAVALPTGDTTLPISFALKGEYAQNTVFTLITASAGIKKGDANAQVSDFTLTATLLEGMTGVLQLADNNTKLQFVITSNTITADAAAVLNGGHLIRRFDANRGVTVDVNNKVTAWTDLCGTTAAHSHNGAPANDQPTLVNGAARNYLDFGTTGSKKDLAFDAVTTAKTVIEVLDIEQNANAFLLGYYGANNFNFHRGGSGEYGNSTHAKFSAVRDNGTAVVNWSGTVIPTGFRVISLKLSQNCSANCFSQDRSENGRNGGRKLSEVLIFDTVLTDEQLAAVESYLSAKWKLNLTNNAASISGNATWSTITWTSNEGIFYSDLPTTITLTGDTTLTVDGAIPSATTITGNYNLTVKGSDGHPLSADDVAKLTFTGVSAAKCIFTDTTIPATAPASGVTYRWEGSTALTTIPFAGNAVAGTIELACPIVNEDLIRVSKNHTYVFDTGFSLNAQRLILCDSDGANQTYTQNGGTITLTKTYTGSNTTTDMPLLFAHYSNAVNTYNLVGGSIIAENGNVMFGRDGQIAMTVGGGTDTATFKARGISRNDRSHTSSLTIANNGLVQIGAGGIDFQAGKKVVLNGGTLEAYDNATVSTTLALEVNADSTIQVDDGKTLTISAPLTGSGNITKTGAGTLKITGSLANYTGTITISEGAYDYGTSRATINLKTSANTTLKFTSSLAEDGNFSFTLAEGSVLPTITLDGETVTSPTFTDNTITFSYTPTVTGAAALYDFPFNGDLTSVGSNTTTLGKDNGPYFTEANDAVLMYSRPHTGDSLTAPFSAAMFATLPTKAKTVLISFGGSASNIFMATGDADNIVTLNYVNGGTTTELTSMTVPNGTTSAHLYAFTISADKKTIDIYLDGVKNVSYTLPNDGTFTFAAGFQVSGWYGGTVSGYSRCDTAEDGGSVDELLVYNGTIGPNAMTELKKLFPYASPNGLFRRTFTESGNWVETGAWQEYDKNGDPVGDPVDKPDNGAQLEITANAAVTVTINEETAQNYESISFEGTGSFSFVKGEGSALLTSLGTAVVNCDTTIAYDSLAIPGVLSLKTGKTLAFDYTNYPIDTVFTSQVITLTGFASASDNVQCTFPSESYGRTMTKIFSTSENRWEISITVPNLPFVYESNAWTWGTQSVTLETVNAYPAIMRDIKSDLTMALGASAYTVESGATLTQSDDSATGTITVNAGGVFDVNGVIDTGLKVVLNGGKLVNNGSAIGVGKKQYVSISQTTASTIGGTGELAYVKQGYGALTLDLGDATLSKVDSNTFTLCNTTVQNGALEIAGGKIVANRAVTFDDTASLTIGADGALEVSTGNSDTLTIGAITGAEGAVLNTLGTITDFTLTGSLKLTGAGTFGTITLDDATIDIAAVRGLTIAGEGNVKATITASELTSGSFTLFTKGTDADIGTITLVDDQGTTLTPSSATFDDNGHYIVTFKVSVTIPNVANTTKVVKIGDEVINPTEEGGTTYLVVPGSNLTITYTADPGYLPATTEKTLTNAQAGATLDVSDVVITQAEAQVGDVLYATVAEALASLEDNTETTVTILVSQAGQTITIPANKVVKFANGDGVEGFAGGATIAGAGTIVYDGALPDNEKSSYQNANWTGTVWIKNYNTTPQNGWKFWEYGNEGSKLQFTNSSGWPHDVTTETTATVVLKDPDGGGYGWRYTSSSGQKCYLRKIAGDGTLSVDSNGGSNWCLVIKDVESFEGNLVTTTFPIYIGNDGTVAANGTKKIYLTSGKTATIPLNKSWTAADGITIDGTISGEGTLNGNVTFSATAVIDATSTLLAVGENNSVTFGNTMTVKLTAAPTENTPVKILSGTFTEQTFDTDLTVVVDDEEVEGKFLIKQDANGVWAISNASFIWTGAGENHNWSNPANWFGGAVPAAGRDVVIDVGSATDYSIVIDSDTAALNSLTVSGSGIVFSGEGTITGPVTINTGNIGGSFKVVGNVTVEAGSVDFSAALTMTGNLTFNKIEPLTFAAGTAIDVTGDMTITADSHNNRTYFNAGSIIVSGTLYTRGGYLNYSRYWYGDGSSDNNTMIVTAPTIDANSWGTVIDNYVLNSGATLRVGTGGLNVSGHITSNQQDFNFNGGTYVATGTSNLSAQRNFVVNKDSTIEVVEGATLTVKNSGKNFGQDGKKITKAGLGLLKFEGPVLTDIDVTAGTVEMTAGDEEGVVVSEGAGLRLKVSTEQEAGGYTSTATIPTGTNIIFILPDGTEVTGQGNVLPAQAATWVGADQGSWDDPANWSPEGVPAATTSVYFTGEGDPITIKIPDGTRTVKNVTFSAARDITIDGAVTVNGTITKSGAGKLGIDLGADYTKNLAISAGALEVIVPEGTTRTLGGLISGSGTFVKSGAGTLKMSSNQFAIPGTLTIDIAEGVFEAGGRDRGFDGKVIVRKGATYNAMIKDFAHYDQSCEIDVYGTLHFGPNVRWTLTQNDLFKIYPGALITGDSTMDGGAHINLHKTGAKVSFITEAGITETTAEIRAVIGPGGNDDAGVVEVAEGLALTLSGNGSSDVNRRKPIIKKGTGTIIVTGDMSGLDGFQVLEGAAAFTGDNTMVKTFKLGNGAIIPATTKTITVQNTLTLPTEGTIVIDVSGVTAMSGEYYVITGPNNFSWDMNKVVLSPSTATDEGWAIGAEGNKLVASKLPLNATVTPDLGDNFDEAVLKINVSTIDSTLTGTQIKVVTTDKTGAMVGDEMFVPIDGSKGTYEVKVGGLTKRETYDFNITFVDSNETQIEGSKELETKQEIGNIIPGVEKFSADATSGESVVDGGYWTADQTINEGAYVIDDDVASVFSVTNAPTGNYTVEYDISFDEGFETELDAEENAPIAGITIGKDNETLYWYRADGKSWAKLDQSVTAGHYLIRMAFTDTTVTYSVKGDTDAAFTTLTQNETSEFTRGGESAAAIQSVSFKGASALAKFGAKTDDKIDTTIALDGDSQLIDSAEGVVTALSNGKTVTLKTNVAIDTSTLDAGTYTINAGDFNVSFVGDTDRTVSFKDGTLTITATTPVNGKSNKVNSDLNLNPAVATDKPFVKAVYTENKNTIAFKLFHGKGATEVAKDPEVNENAKFYVESSSDSTFKTGVEKSPSKGVKETLEVPLPTGNSKVRYYRLKFNAE